MGTTWQPVERVRLSRRIVTELRQVEIEVRREELVVERSPVDDPADHPVSPGPDRVTNDDLVIVLSEEVPMGARAYERVVIDTNVGRP